MDPKRSFAFLGVDYGRRRTGLSRSDPEGRLATPLETLTFRGLDDLAARIAEIARDVEAPVAGIVLGMPRHMDGRPGDLVPEVEALAERLRKRGLRVILWDETLTSWEAEALLRESRRPTRRKKGLVDAAAATLLLQSYLESLRE